MGRSQVSACEGVFLVAEPGEKLRHRHDPRAQGLLDQGCKPEAGDPADLLQGDAAFALQRMTDPRIQRCKDGGTIVPLDGQHERKAEFRGIGRI